MWCTPRVILVSLALCIFQATETHAAQELQDLVEEINQLRLELDEEKASLKKSIQNAQTDLLQQFVQMKQDYSKFSKGVLVDLKVGKSLFLVTELYVQALKNPPMSHFCAFCDIWEAEGRTVTYDKLLLDYAFK